MLFAIITKDRPGALDLRQSTREEHLAYLKAFGAGMVLAGPFLDSEGKPNGSLVVIEAHDLEAARDFANNDPYNQAGLFENVQIRPWNWAINNKEGR